VPLLVQLFKFKLSFRIVNAHYIKAGLQYTIM
jgi:hypothetical protein